MELSAVPQLKPNVFGEQQRALMDGESVDNTCKGRYLDLRRRVYLFLERPNSNLAITYHLMNLVLIVGSIITSILSTIETYEDNDTLKNLILYYELALLSWFSLEYIARLWSCSYVGSYKGLCGRIRFMKTLYMAIDLFVIISTLVTAILSIKTAYFTILRITRFLQIFRVLRLDRQRGDLRTMGRVVYKHGKELVTCYFVGFIILFGGTYLIYIIEKVGAEASTIDNMANGLYWAMITVTSVGYGDISPETWAGKLLTGVFALVGCAFFALPAGILGSGFALQVAKQKKQLRFIKVRNPAAVVIQTCWRYYSVRSHHEHLEGTWFFFFPRVPKDEVNLSYFKLLPGMQDVLNGKYAPRLSKGSHESHASSPNKEKEKKGGVFNIGKLKQHLNVPRADGNNAQKKGDKEESRRGQRFQRLRRTVRNSRKKSQHPSDDVPLCNLINKQYKEAIRFVLKIKLLNYIKHFKNVRYPFVNVQDIMEKNALAHTETMSHLKHIQDEMIQVKLEMKALRSLLIKVHKLPPQVVNVNKNPDSDSETDTFYDLSAISEGDEINNNDIQIVITRNDGPSNANGSVVTLSNGVVVPSNSNGHIGDVSNIGNGVVDSTNEDASSPPALDMDTVDPVENAMVENVGNQQHNHTNGNVDT